MQTIWKPKGQRELLSCQMMWVITRDDGERDLRRTHKENVLTLNICNQRKERYLTKLPTEWDLLLLAFPAGFFFPRVNPGGTKSSLESRTEEKRTGSGVYMIPFATEGSKADIQMTWGSQTAQFKWIYN